MSKEAMNAAPVSAFRESVYESLSELYDMWYEGHWDEPEPAASFLELARRMWGKKSLAVDQIRILDCACGTGNPYIALRRIGYDVWGTDGSVGMLARAALNCEEAGVAADKIVRTPISWTDLDSYLTHFDRESFDLIIIGSNSFCHLPPTARHMEAALRNFSELLKSGGLLLIDTKKYELEGEIDGVPLRKELMYDKDAKRWIIRRSRHDEREIDGAGKVHFHTYVHHDIDLSFGDGMCRALIAITAFGEKFDRRFMCLPYYPLPATSLAEKMKNVGLSVTVQEADGEVSRPYDIVIGQK